MDAFVDVQHLINSKNFFQTIVRCAQDPAQKSVLYSACCGLLQKSPEGQQALPKLLEDARLAAGCLCRDISAQPPQGLQGLVHIAATIFAQEQAASALKQHEHLQLVQVLVDLLESTHDRVGCVLNQHLVPCM